jgi:molybdopterin/thiamine biosynthesis adenylyltransferase
VASEESHTDTTVLPDILDDVEEIIESQQKPDDGELLKELNSVQTLRFKGASWFENMKDAEIIVAGVGGIGSWVTLLLSRMTPSNIVLFDDDNVELTNMAGQCYMEESIGESKVTAMQNVCEKMSRYKSILGFQEKFNYDSATADIMICGFDNMFARRTFYNAWKQRVIKKAPEERSKCILIDGRLLMEEFQVFALTGDGVENMKIYEDRFLFSDSEMVEPLCSQKQTSHMAAMIASVMVGILTNFLSPCKEWEFPRKVPFLTEFDMPSMMFKTQM